MLGLCWKWTIVNGLMHRSGMIGICLGILWNFDGAVG